VTCGSDENWSGIISVEMDARLGMGEGPVCVRVSRRGGLLCALGLLPMVVGGRQVAGELASGGTEAAPAGETEAQEEKAEWVRLLAPK
jgi:hypothetical protein